MAFGTNLLGAILGGCLEYSSLLIGNRDLIVVAAVIYALAYLATPARRATSARNDSAAVSLVGASS
jgi:hypothetical protein